VTAVQSPLTGYKETDVSAIITGLTDGSYIFRVKAENSLGTVCSWPHEGFDIGGQSPTATTLAATNLASGTATLNCRVNANSLLTGIAFEYGTTTSYGQESTGSFIAGDTSTNVSICITGLTNGVTYHYRVRAANSIGLAYGNDMEFTLNAPTAETLEATDLTSTSATLNGIVNANSFLTNVTFEYGTTTSYGQEVSPEQGQVTGNEGTNVSAALTGITCGIEYHYRVKAENSYGISYGSDKTIKTGLLSLITTPVSAITATTAISGGAIIIECPYSSITHRGIEWWIVGHSGIGGGRGPYSFPPHIIKEGTATGSFTINMTGLRPSTAYYVRAYATDNVGTTYGKTVYFKTLSSGK
jgi:hypothetical protein